MTSLRLLAACAVSIALPLSACGDARAQAKFPSRTVEVVVPYAPGGGTDNLMRMITGIIDENKWSSVPLNVNNRAGGGGAVGFNYLITKKGDSHVVAGATPMIVSGKIEGRLPGNHRGAMTILMIVAIDELMLSVRNESPFKTIDDFVNAARAKPSTLTVGGTATNSEDHIFTYLFEQAAKIKVKYVPFNSGGEVTAALMGGHIDAGVMNPNEIIAQIEARKATTPDHVFRKVRADYDVRLGEAQDRLAAETGAVQALVTNLEATRATQDEKIGAKTDERSEAELRASVGEFGEKEWDKLRGKLEAEKEKVRQAK